MKVSVCYITKNADEFLDYSMWSIELIADEIIVIDDNSTDKTLEIAERHNARVFKGKFNRDKRIQRNQYLKAAKGDWILQVDDDEVYKEGDLKKLYNLMETEDADNIRIPLLHFWKDPKHIITGHHWDQRFERCFKNLSDITYRVHHMVSDNQGHWLTDSRFHPQHFTEGIHIFHYAFLKNPEKIKEKIRHYMLRDNPNVTQDNVDKWVNKHPYFSNDFTHPRFGPKGLEIAGNAEGMQEAIKEFNGQHPKVMYENPLFS